MKMNLLQVLRNRQLGEGACTYSILRRSLPKVIVLLKDILDCNRTMLQGHVIVGFTWQGDFVISYQLTIDCDEDTMIENGSATHHYSLHWWKFNINKPLEHVWSVNIFKGMTITSSVKLILCQSIDQSYVTIFGYTELVSSCTCYVSIVSSPLAPPNCDHTSIHITYEVFPPFPVIVPSLCLSVDDCVLINTGCGLYAISHNLSSNDSLKYDHHCLWNSEECNDSRDNSLTRSLQLEVYWKDDCVTGSINSNSNDSINSNVSVYQRSVDIEQWLYEQLSQIFSSDIVSLQSIINYDLQLLEVYSTRQVVIFITVALVEVCDYSMESATSQSTVNLIGSWNIPMGTIELLSHSISSDDQLSTDTRVWNPGKSIVSEIRTRSHPRHTPHLQVFSNHTVSTGKSLSVLHHPYLPLSLVLNNNTSKI